MNKEEIMALEARQKIDELVAIHVMGWHKVLREKYRDSWYNENDSYMCEVSRYDGFEDDEDFHTICWHPSESILWADQVLDTLPGARITKTFGMSGVKYILKVGDIEIFENSLPLGICKIALLTKI